MVDKFSHRRLMDLACFQLLIQSISEDCKIGKEFTDTDKDYN